MKFQKSSILNFVAAFGPNTIDGHALVRAQNSPHHDSMFFFSSWTPEKYATVLFQGQTWVGGCPETSPASQPGNAQVREWATT